MRRLYPLAICTIALLCLAGSAQAQIDCDDCSPYYNWCSETCGVCTQYTQDGCSEWEWSTCGDILGANCLEDNCTPNWQTTERVSVGFYGETQYGLSYHDWQWWPRWSCDHHTVDRVTVSDLNECNLNSYWWSVAHCEDYVDYSSLWYEDHIPDCCAYPFYCNDWHSCF